MSLVKPFTRKATQKSKILITNCNFVRKYYGAFIRIRKLFSTIKIIIETIEILLRNRILLTGQISHEISEKIKIFEKIGLFREQLKFQKNIKNFGVKFKLWSKIENLKNGISLPFSQKWDNILLIL